MDQAMKAVLAPKEKDAGREELAARCGRLESMIMSMDQGLAFVDAAGIVAEINGRCLEFLGLSRETVFGKPYAVLGLDTEEYQTSAIIDLFARGATHAPVSFNARLRDADVSVTIQPVLNGASFGGVVVSLMDVTPLVEARLAVEREKTFLEQIIAIAGAAIVIVNRDGVIVNVNEEFTRITGYSREETLGRKRGTILDDEPGGRFAPGERISKQERVIHSRSGEAVAILKNAAPLFDAFGLPVGGIESFVDVTELISAGKKAEEANRLKSVFLANMSHEIRTPLNALLGLPQLLERTPLTGEQREFLDAMRSAGKSLLVIVNDILDFSKIEAGRMAIVRRPVNLRTLFEDIRRLMSGAAEEKGLAFTVSLDPGLPVLVETDDLRLRQILVNLLSNAIKFTAEGGVDMRAQRIGGENAPGGECLARFLVTDSGMGVPLNLRERIFESFTQADEDVSRHHGGTGLGLSISRRLAALLGGGPIAVDDAPGGGSVFSFDLPLRVLAPGTAAFDAAPQCEPPRGQADFSDLSALVAEDNAFNRFLLRKVLEQFGVTDVIFADNGLTAVERTLEAMGEGRRLDVIFMDLRMPGLDGLEAARKIREAGSDTPIVALTAQALNEAGRNCLEAGMDYYFSKPYDIKDLERVLTLVSARRERGGPDAA